MTELMNGRDRAPRALSLSRNTAALGVGYLLRTPVLLVYFVLATRSLGVETYGVLAAVMAVCTITGPLASLGTTTLLVKHAARDPDSARTWLGAGLSLSILGSVVLGTLVMLVSPVLLPPGTPILALALLLAGELVLARAIDLSGAVFVATERMHLKTVIQLGFPLVRLVAVLVLVLGPWPVTLTGWALAAVLGSLIWSVVSLWLAARAVGAPRWSMAIYRSDWRQGLLFAAGLGTTNVHNDADKIVLARLAGPEAAGVYAAAYRLIDAAYTPVRALLGAAFPRMFRHGADGSAALAPFLLRLSRPALGYSLLVVPALILLAPLAPPVLGEGFAGSAPVLTALAMVIVLRTLRALPADALAGVGHQGLRATAQLVVAIVNVAALLVLVPRLGVWGAVASTLASEALLAAVLWSLWVWTRRAHTRSPHAPSARSSSPGARAAGEHDETEARGDGPAPAAPVVLVTGVLNPRRGMEVALLELARELARERPVEIVLVHGPDPGGAPVPVSTLPPGGRLRRARALRELLDRQPDATIVLCGLWATAHVVVAAPRVVPRAVGWEHSLTAARLRAAGPRTRLRMHLAGRAYRRARAVVAVGEEVATTLRRTWQVEPCVVPNLVPSTRAGAAGGRGQGPRGEQDGARLLTVGALVPVKNHPLVLQALARLPRTWTLTVAGAGPEQDRLRELSAELGVEERVSWLGHIDDVGSHMDKADALLQPSTSETFGYTLLEAGQAHLPVVVLDVPVVRDVVPDLAPGLLVSDPDPEAFAAAVRRVIAGAEAAAWDFTGADDRRRARFGKEGVMTAWREILG